MAIPKFESFLYPFLALLKDKDAKKDEIKAALVKQFNLTEDECKQKTKSGTNYVLDSHLGWVRQWLRRAIFIEIPKRGVYRITQRGKDYLNTHTTLSEKDLLQYPEYQEYFYGGKGTNRKKKQKDASVVASPKEEKQSKVKGEGYCYIITNPAFTKNYIKIGYTDSLERRLNDLFNTSVPERFEVYAALKSFKYKEAEELMHKAFEERRVSPDREFFLMLKETALDYLKVIAKGLGGELLIYGKDGKPKNTFKY